MSAPPENTKSRKSRESVLQDDLHILTAQASSLCKVTICISPLYSASPGSVKRGIEVKKTKCSLRCFAGGCVIRQGVPVAQMKK